MDIKTSGMIDMLAINCDLDELNQLRKLFRVINKLELPNQCETIIYISKCNGDRTPYYIHSIRKN